jgi:hypothetical protein
MVKPNPLHLDSIFFLKGFGCCLWKTVCQTQHHLWLVYLFISIFYYYTLLWSLAFVSSACDCINLVIGSNRDWSQIRIRGTVVNWALNLYPWPKQASCKKKKLPLTGYALLWSKSINQLYDAQFVSVHAPLSWQLNLSFACWSWHWI